MGLANFEHAFNHGGTQLGTCECGKSYFDNANDWCDPSEYGRTIDDYRDDENYIPVDGSFGYVYFEGKEYVNACNCWHERAGKIMQFIDTHNRAIADYLNLEKKQALEVARMMPGVDEDA